MARYNIGQLVSCLVVKVPTLQLKRVTALESNVSDTVPGVHVALGAVF